MYNFCFLVKKCLCPMRKQIYVSCMFSNHSTFENGYIYIYTHTYIYIYISIFICYNYSITNIIIIIIITTTISSNKIGAVAALFFTKHSVEL